MMKYTLSAVIAQFYENDFTFYPLTGNVQCSWFHAAIVAKIRQSIMYYFCLLFLSVVKLKMKALKF